MGSAKSKQSAAATTTLIQANKINPKHLKSASPSSSDRYILSPDFVSRLVQASVPPDTPLTSEDTERLSKWITRSKATPPQSGSLPAKLETRVCAFLGQGSRLGLRDRLRLKEKISELPRSESKLEKLVLGALQEASRVNPVLGALLWLKTGLLKSLFPRTTTLTTTKSLRKTTSLPLLDGKKGERAHTLSLSVAVVLWEVVHGNKRIDNDKLRALKYALNQELNLRVTCEHTNKVLHVGYDKEIVAALNEDEKGNMSQGTKKRLKEVVNVCERLSEECAPEVKPFFRDAAQVLKTIQ